MSNTYSFGRDAIARRFRIPDPPTLLARLSAAAPISFSRLRRTEFGHGRIDNVSPEAAFVFQVQLAPLQSVEVAADGGRSQVFSVAPGEVVLFDLSTSIRNTLGSIATADTPR